MKMIITGMALNGLTVTIMTEVFTVLFVKQLMVRRNSYLY